MITQLEVNYNATRGELQRWTYLVEQAALEADVVRMLHEHRPAAVHAPVARGRHFVRLGHERRAGLDEQFDVKTTQNPF